jgi:hypothetical protein
MDFLVIGNIHMKALNYGLSLAESMEFLNCHKV